MAALVVARVRRAVFVLEVRDLWPEILIVMGGMSKRSLTYRLLRRLEQRLYREASAIIVLTDGVRDELVSRGVPATKITVIPNAADPQDFSTSRSRTEIRDELKFHGFVVLYAGAHGAANGLNYVLDAADELRDELTDVTFVLVGDGPVKEALIRRARQNRLTNVRFLDPLPKTRMPEVLAAADVGLHVLADVPLFRHGVSPNKIYDYMAAGLPIITNTEGEVSELVRGAGVPCAPNGIAEAVRECWSTTPDQRRRWGEAGRHFLATSRSRAEMAARLQDLLTRLACT